MSGTKGMKMKKPKTKATISLTAKITPQTDKKISDYISKHSGTKTWIVNKALDLFFSKNK